jgi:hypothetical protein
MITNNSAPMAPFERPFLQLRHRLAPRSSRS